MDDETKQQLIKLAQKFLDDPNPSDDGDTKVIYNPTAEELVNEGFNFAPKTAIITPTDVEILEETGVLKVVVDFAAQQYVVWIRMCPL